MAIKIECRHCGYYQPDNSQLDDTGACRRIEQDDSIPTTADSFCPYFKRTIDLAREKLESFLRLAEKIENIKKRKERRCGGEVSRRVTGAGQD